jgi:NAD(P)-dependent dehydrogenase (short-subunit alcohol dehydrogenase family)
VTSVEQFVAGGEPHADGGQVVVISGASGGIGRGIAIACGARGHTVWIAARRPLQGQAVAAEVDAAGGHGRFVACDTADLDSVHAAVEMVLERDGRLDAVVHNAVSGEAPKPVPLAILPLNDFHDHVAVSLRGGWLLAIAAHNALKASRGRFILMTSEMGFEGKRLMPAGAMIKAAERGFARALAREWGPDGITVNCIAPLAMTPAMDRAFLLEPAMRQRVEQRIPSRRIGDAEADIGPVVAALLEPGMSYVTGNTLMVDGGSCPIS